METYATDAVTSVQSLIDNVGAVPLMLAGLGVLYARMRGSWTAVWGVVVGVAMLVAFHAFMADTMTGLSAELTLVG